MFEFVESIEDDEPIRAWRSSLRIAAASLSCDPPPLMPFVAVYCGVADAAVVVVIVADVELLALLLMLLLLPTAICCGARCAFADGPSD